MIMKSRRDGFAIPMAILLIGVITAGVVGAFARVESESSVVNSRDAQTVAYALAEAGMGVYLADRANMPFGRDFTLPGGTAEVRVDLMRPDDGVNGALYLLRSTGITTSGGNIPSARHTVTQLAWLKPYTINVPAGWTSLSGIRKDGNSGEMSGFDECLATGPKAGVAVPDSGYSGQTGPVMGDPPIDYMGSQEDMAGQINIDWEGIINEDVLQFDIRIPPGVWPSADSFAARPDWWPVVYIDNENGPAFDPSDMNGRGTLIIRGDIKLDGGDEWDGIVMVGGKLEDNGTGAISGAVITGLNVKLGEPVEESSRAHGTKTYRYNSCDLSNALQAMSVLTPIRNTWFDGWAGY